MGHVWTMVMLFLQPRGVNSLGVSFSCLKIFELLNVPKIQIFMYIIVLDTDNKFVKGVKTLNFHPINTFFLRVLFWHHDH